MEDNEIKIYENTFDNCVEVFDNQYAIKEEQLERVLKPVKQNLRALHPNTRLRFKIFINSPTSILVIGIIQKKVSELSLKDEAKAHEEGLSILIKHSNDYHKIVSEGNHEDLILFENVLGPKLRKQVTALTISRSRADFSGLSVISAGEEIVVSKLPLTAGEILMQEPMSAQAFVNVIYRGSFKLTFIQAGTSYNILYSHTFASEVMQKCDKYQIVELGFNATFRKDKLIKGVLTSIEGFGAPKPIQVDMGL